VAFSESTIAFLRARAIDPDVAADIGVQEERDELIFPGGRRRSLNGAGPTKVIQPKGKSLRLWWPEGHPADLSALALVCEGETDALAGLSALRAVPSGADLGAIAVTAIPGTGYPIKRLVQELRDAGIGVSLLALDGDEAGHSYTNRAEGALRDAGIRAVVVEMPEGSDLAEVLAGADDPGAALASLLADALAVAEDASPSTPRDGGATVQPPVDRGAAWQVCADLAHEPRILERFAAELPRVGLVGEDELAQILYLAITSRLLLKPVSVVVKGPSAGGKSFTVEVTLGFFPEGAFYTLTGMSERALAYSEEPLKHRTLVIYEAVGMESEFASYLIRSLLSEGCVRYETVEKTKQGMKARLVEREGPTGLIATTTRIRLHPENETRLLSVTVKDTREQTKAIMRAIAEEDEPEVDLAPWLALQRWIEPRTVTVPYAKALAELVPAAAVRLRRDFGAVLGLVRAHALLHQVTRPEDERGRVVATIEDYEVVRELVAPLVSDAVEATVPTHIRETVEAVADANVEDGISRSGLARGLELDKSTVSRRVDGAIERGYLRDLRKPEERGKPSRLVLGDELPEDQEILPLPEALEEGCCTVARPTGGIKPTEDEMREIGLDPMPEREE
jgi:hypothetical protein